MGQIDLPSRLNFQTSARDLEFHTALKKIVYPQNIPTPFFYPRSQYGVAGLGADCIPYDYYALLQAFGVVDCGSAPYNSDPATQYACKQTNDPKLQQIAMMAPAYGTCITADMIPGPYTPTPGSAGDTSSSGGSGIIMIPWGTQPSGGITYTAPSTPYTPPSTSTPPATTGGGGNSTPASSYSPTVSFIPSRAGTLYPGDTWQLHIQGGKPGAVVSVTGTQNGVTNTNQMGATDQNGNWSTSGTIDASSIGSWFEVWYVGGQMAASPFSFNVASPSSPASGGSTGTQTPSGTQSSTPPPSSGGMTQTQTPAPSSSDGMIFGVPQNYVLMGGAAILLLAVMGGRR